MTECVLHTIMQVSDGIFVSIISLLIQHFWFLSIAYCGPILSSTFCIKIS